MVAVAWITGFGFAARNAMRLLLFDASADAFLRRSSRLEHLVAVALSELGKPTMFLTIIAFVVVALVLFCDYRAAVAAVLDGSELD